MARNYNDYSKDALIAHIYELEKQLKNNKYGLYWDRSIDQESVINDCKNNIPYFERIKEECIINNPDGNTNLLIEGDNFMSLTAINMMGDNIIDTIYIDPPYNTGNEDFIYNDKFVDTEDGYRHSKWLGFMEKRLVLARRLLKQNGLIFISIDYRECGTLRLLCDKIFGETNFIANFVWMKTATASFLSKTVRNKMEYVLCYKKSNLNYVLNGGEIEGGDAPLINASNRITSAVFPKESITFNIPDGKYPAGERDSATIDKEIEIVDGKPLDDVCLTGRFKWTQETIDNEVKLGTTFIIKSNKFSIRFLRTTKNTKIPSNLITRDECQVGTNEEGAKEIKEILGGAAFDYVKPVSLIKYLINMNPKKDAVVMDFFVGSGTTAQAVLELNKEDGGNRKFIVCTNNENNICKDVTLPRIKTVITGKKPDGSYYSEGHDVNLMYYSMNQLQDSRNTDQAKYSLVARVDELLCILEDTFVAIEQNEFYSVYESFDGNKRAFIYTEYYREDAFEKYLESVKSYDGEKVAYVFSDDNIIDESLFKGVNGVVVKSIPNKIYEIYKEIVEEIKRGEQ